VYYYLVTIWIELVKLLDHDLVDSSLKTLFENYLQDIGCTKAEAQTVVPSLEQERSLTDKLAHVLQVIRSVNFDWDKCPIKVLEDHLQEKNLELEILNDNPVLFSVKIVQQISRFFSVISNSSSTCEY